MRVTVTVSPYEDKGQTAISVAHVYTVDNASRLHLFHLESRPSHCDIRPVI